jgi:hypothetical protein
MPVVEIAADILDKVVDTEGPIGRGGLAVPFKVERMQLEVPGEDRKERCELVACPESAVKEEKIGSARRHARPFVRA